MENKQKPKTLIARIDPELSKRLKHHLIDTSKSQQDFLSEAITEKLAREHISVDLDKLEARVKRGLEDAKQGKVSKIDLEKL